MSKSVSVVVGSTNPVKLRAVQTGFATILGGGVDVRVEGVDAPSGVASQPLSDEETLRGARNRARGAHAARPAADFWVGVEGGIAPALPRQDDSDKQQQLSFAWIVVLSPADAAGQLRQGEARSASFMLPPRVSELIATGMELGEADDVVFGTQNSKQAAGAVGLLTSNAIDRCALYATPTALALIPHINPSLYPN